MSETDAAATLLKRLKLNYELDEIDLVAAFEFYHSHLDVNKSDKDRLAIIIHLIMLKENFANERDHLELNQSVGGLYNKLNYNLILVDARQNLKFTLSSNLVVTLLKSGKFVELHCKYKMFHSEFLKINLSELFVAKKQLEHAALNFDYLNKHLRVNFVDKCLMGVKSCIKNENLDICRQARYFSNGLVDLPVEILLFKIVLKYLNVKNIGRLMQTSKYFYDLLNGDVSTDKSIWFYLLRRDFGNAAAVASNNSTSLVNFKKAYFKNYKFYLI